MFNSTNSLGTAVVQPLAPSGMTSGQRLPGLPEAANPAGPRMKARAQRRMKLSREDILAHRTAKLNEQGRRAARSREKEQARREQAKARNEARAEERARKRLAAQDQRPAGNRPGRYAKSAHPPEPQLRARQADGAEDLSPRRSVFGPELQHDCNARLQEVAARYGLIVQVIDARKGAANAIVNASAHQSIACAGGSPIIIDADRAPALAALQELGVLRARWWTKTRIPAGASSRSPALGNATGAASLA